MCMSIGMLLVILPVYANDELGAGSFGVALTVAAVSPMLLVFQPIAGRIGDRKGRRVLIVVGAVIASVSIAAYVLVGSLELLIAVRLVTGIGEAMLLVGAATMVTDIAPEKRRGEALSLYSLGLWGGLALGPLLGELVLGSDRFDAVWLLAAGCLPRRRCDRPHAAGDRSESDRRTGADCLASRPPCCGGTGSRPGRDRLRIRRARDVRGALRARARHGRRGRGVPRLLRRSSSRRGSSAASCPTGSGRSGHQAPHSR